MRLFTTALVLTSSLIFAQEMPEMNGQNMELMMKEMQKMQACMAKVNFDSLASLQEKAFSVQKEVEQMCKQGKRDKAQSTAIAFSNEVMKFPAVVQLKQCTKGTTMESMMEMSKQDFEKHHICDGEKVEFALPSNQRIQW